ncbi:MAG TPA: hypothetical protein VKX17_18565 [Planctomycetota bacterium]|nr:hypothetical protein [Planctomycetota bacterium]
MPQPAIAKAAPAKAWYDSTVLCMVLLVFLWPAGVFALIKNRRLGAFSKLIIGGGISVMLLAALGTSGFAGYWYYKHRTFADLPFIGKYLKPTRVAENSVPKNTAKDISKDAGKELAKDMTKPSDLPLPPDNRTPDKVPDNPPPDTKTPDNPQPDLKVPDSKSQDTKTPDSKAPDTKPPETKLPDTKTPDAKEPDLKIPDTKAPDTKVPDAKIPDTPKLDPAERAAEEKRKQDDALKAKELADAKAKLDAANAEREKAELERKQKENADLANAEQAARKLDTIAAELRDRAVLQANQKAQQATKYKNALADYNSAIALEPQLSNLEVAFKLHVQDVYKTDRIDEAKFNEFFNDEYLHDYNTKEKKRQSAVGGYVRALRESDAALSADEKKLKAEIEDTNKKLAAAGRPLIELPPPDEALEKDLAASRAAAAALPEKLVTLDDLRERLGIKASGKAPRPAIADNRNSKDPFAPKSNDNGGDTVPLPPDTKPRQPAVDFNPKDILPKQPDQPSQPKIPDAIPNETPGAISSADIQGIWTRSDGRVQWSLDAGGIMFVHGPRRTQGSWTFDDKTNALTVNHGGVLMKFTVSKNQDQLSMVGGAGSNATLHFNKAGAGDRR